VTAHEVLAREVRVLLDPDDRLAGVEPGTGEGGWVVGHVGVAAPDVEGAAGAQDPRGVAVPGREALGELGVADEVALERAVLGAQLASW
jgi:hypothetical protein